MNRIADAVIVQWGLRRAMLAFLAGAVSVLALPPFSIWPVPWATMPVLIWLLDGAVGPEGASLLRRLLPAAAVGWWFGFGYFLAGLWWVGASFLVDAATFGWLLPVAVVLLPAGLALFWALGTAAARLFWPEGWSRIAVFAVAMTLVEWLRSWTFTGFPWNAFGYTLMPGPILMQAASAIGLWGVTLLAFLVFSAPAVLAGSGPRRGRWMAIAVVLVLLGVDAGYGVLRLRSATDAVVPDVRLRIVQPSIPQTLKNDPNEAAANFRKYLELSDTATSPERTGAGSATHIVWPETAVPFLLTAQPGALTAIADLLPEGTALITGAPRVGPPPPGSELPQVFNSVLVIDDRGEIIDSYDKVHLVPFGEYLPFNGFLEQFGLRQVVPVPPGFSAGLSRKTMTSGRGPAFAPLICYEVIFPAEVVDRDDRPGWFLNVTNDAWYGDTPGPRQHLQQAAVRAVEQGLPLVRAANTGISAIIDPYGRIRASLDLNQVGVIDGELPAALPPTLYARHGDLVAFALLLLVAIAAAVGQFTMARESRRLAVDFSRPKS